MGLKPGREKSVKEAMQVFEAGGFGNGAARSSLVGKLYFTISTAFGRTSGVSASLHCKCFATRTRRMNSYELLWRSFFLSILAYMPVRKIRMMARSSKRPILI